MRRWGLSPFPAAADQEADAELLDPPAAVGFQHPQRHGDLRLPPPRGPPLAVLFGGVGRKQVKAQDVDAAGPQALGDALQVPPGRLPPSAGAGTC